MNQEIIDLLGQVISGLQVPMSLSLESGFNSMGTARDPYIILRDELGLFGYPDAEKCARALVKALEDKDG